MADKSTLAVGIDLGTTNCALAALDRETGAPAHEGAAWPIPQVVHANETAPRPLLPSFLYLPGEHELPEGALDLPWAKKRTFTAGEFAREQGAKVPARVITSAKSWLCHPGVDRRAEILPFGAPPEVPKLSPLAASARYLSHLREAWEAEHKKQKLEEQDVVITVPASFDAVARDLTVEAAALAGLPKITLLEEPQAALYAWLEGRGDSWRKDLKVGDVLLVCDVGGGTSDFSLIAVLEEQGNLVLHRVAVGDHLLLGGDNMDLALAHAVKTKLEAQGKQLDTWQFHGLQHGARAAKEALFADAKLDKAPIAVAGRGTKLVGGTIRTELTRDELLQLLVDGFFPRVEANAKPAVARRVGLTQLGLPYAQDPAVTRHLASFLSRQVGALSQVPAAPAQPTNATFLHPTAILFNGGVFKAQALQDRIVDVVNGWLKAEGAPAMRVLQGANLDLAVARGAAAYARVRAGQGIRIRGGIARSYYVGVESAMPAVPGIAPPIKAVCVAPFGMEEGTDVELGTQEFGLVVGEPVEFRFFASARRSDDQVGTTLERWSDDELEEVAPIAATLPADGAPAGEVIPVHLHAAVTATGTLALSATPSRKPGSDQRWKLEFNVRLRGAE
ncbi:MAG: Hsp70 family protein [Deltaproteobacteria bacterium]|nr:Hsp70 family protein [Deltaproteobacteria bacterium]